MTENWTQTNQKYLAACIGEVKTLLKNHVSKLNGEDSQVLVAAPLPEIPEGSPPALEILSNLFGLSPFEKQVLVLCAAVDLDSEVKVLCAKAQGNPNMSYVTFGLALACFPKAHWSAVSPTSPLRRFKLVELSLSNCSNSITTSQLSIAERVLHYLTGVFYLDTQLQGIVKPTTCKSQLVNSHQQILETILAIWQPTKQKLPLIQMFGADENGKQSIVQHACAQTGLELWCLPAELIPQKPEETQELANLWTRESALLGAGIFVSAEDADAGVMKGVVGFIESVPGPVFLSTRERRQVAIDSAVSLEVNKPLKIEQRHLWESYLANESLNQHGVISGLVGQFDLNASAIKTIIQDAKLLVKGGATLTEALWQSACAVTRPKISELAQQITPKATLNSLVLPQREKQLLEGIALHVAQRQKVYGEWGFENASSRGLGITVLFSGSSGTGKTMAAEVIANELHLDLFRIDLSAVVSKYIGETEKNMRKLFDAAEEGGAILFFDEADALFGKRTEVKDSHDRYANIEVNYLLQRMENYRGLAILATNMREALDSAFVRRLKFIVNFPFPDEKSRIEIWKRIFPKETPIDHLDFERLAKLNIAGGNIRNIALYSAFLAASESAAVGMRHVKRAAQVEYAKMEKPLTQAETGDW